MTLDKYCVKDEGVMYVFYYDKKPEELLIYGRDVSPEHAVLEAIGYGINKYDWFEDTSVILLNQESLDALL